MTIFTFLLLFKEYTSMFYIIVLLVIYIIWLIIFKIVVE